MPTETRRRWETDTRFYETIVVIDLLGDITLLTRWGGKHNRMGGCQISALGELNVKTKIDEIEIRRRKHRYREITKDDFLADLLELRY